MFTMLLKFPTRTTKSQFRWKKERPRENKIHSSLIRWWLHSLYLRTYLKTGWSEKGKWKCWRRTLKMCRKKFVLQKRNLRVFSCCITQLNRICDDKICRKVIRIAGKMYNLYIIKWTHRFKTSNGCRQSNATRSLWFAIFILLKATATERRKQKKYIFRLTTINAFAQIYNEIIPIANKRKMEYFPFS